MVLPCMALIGLAKFMKPPVFGAAAGGGGGKGDPVLEALLTDLPEGVRTSSAAAADGVLALADWHLCRKFSRAS